MNENVPVVSAETRLEMVMVKPSVSTLHVMLERLVETFAQVEVEVKSEG